jgi:hypothetical protein
MTGQEDLFKHRARQRLRTHRPRRQATKATRVQVQAVLDAMAPMKDENGSQDQGLSVLPEKSIKIPVGQLDIRASVPRLQNNGFIKDRS